MGYNVPKVTVDNVSFGPGVLYAGACGVCPVTDIGAVRSGAELVITREKIMLEQGSPYQLIVQHVIRETVVLNVTGVEWNFENLVRGLGSGELLEDGPPATYKRFRFGGDMGISHLSLCYRHHMAEGDEVWVKLWCAQGNGEITVTWGDDYHEFPFSFTAIQPDPLNAWEHDLHNPGEVLGPKEHLCEIYREIV